MARKLDSARSLHHVMIRGIEQVRIVDDAKEEVEIEELKGGSLRAQMQGIRSELAVTLMGSAVFPGRRSGDSWGYHLCELEGAKQKM
jgi:hypothetical protein